MTEVANYASLAIAPSTRAAYSHGEQRYRDFCRVCKWTPLPASDLMLASFAAYLARSVKPGTVANYIAAVRNLHLECGMADPTASATLLPRVMKGIKRANGTAVTHARLPMTFQLIRKVIDQLQVDASICDEDRKMLRAAILLAFFGFLRCGEIVSEPTQFDPRFDATRDSVSVAYHSGRLALHFRVKRSKTDPFAKGMTLFIGPTSPPYCPVTAMVQYLSTHVSSGQDPLFQFSSGRQLTRVYLVDKLRALLVAAGVPCASNYSGHSFRIGAATTAASCGIPEWQIRAMGRWQSDCVIRYIRTNPSDLLSISQSLSAALI